MLEEHLLPLADALRSRTRAGLRQLHGGIAYGCAAAFCSASLRGGDVDLLEAAYHRFMAAAGGGLDRLGTVVRLREGAREGLFYLRDTCCLLLHLGREDAVRQLLPGHQPGQDRRLPGCCGVTRSICKDDGAPVRAATLVQPARARPN
ncbi:hypothetical protein, partial [Nonomuraea dietziae]|uniref:hypothetical protein n=1 Tax=Nonomuraea dietziae TaxID=65515 RepID=UPI0031D270AB